MDEPVPAAELGIPRSGAKGRARGAAPRAESPTARGDQGAAPRLSLASGVAPVAPSTTNGKAGGRCGPLSLTEIPLERRGEGREIGNGVRRWEKQSPFRTM
jgi:hypothetical protein